MRMSLRAESAENRGNDEYPFGFVYFSDGMRVTYTGRKSGDGYTYEIGSGSGGWGPITETHRRLAGEYLRSGT